MTPADKEQIRQSVLEELARRHPVPMTAPGVRRAIATELPFPIPPEEIEAALEYLRGLAMASFAQDDMGPTKWWTATTAGVQKVERANR